VPETKRLKTFAAQKERSLPKEPAATQQYEGGVPGLQVPSRNTGRGVHRRGKLKGRQACKHRETDKRATSLLARRGV
jgi:hypothetical protein